MVFTCLPGNPQGEMENETPRDAWAHHAWVTWLKPTDSLMISGSVRLYNMPSWLSAIDDDDSQNTLPRLENDVLYLASDLVARRPSTWNNLYCIRAFDGANLFYVWFYISESPPPWPIPVADFVGLPLSGPSPLSVQFTDLTTNTPLIWLWNFGDGVLSDLQNPLHVYAEMGVYTVSLVARNDDGLSYCEKVAYIEALALPAVFAPLWTVDISPSVV